MNRRAMPSGRQAFTLIELLVVIAIVGLLSTVGVISYGSARAKAKIAAGQQFSSSTNNLIYDELILEWTFDSPAIGDITADSSGRGNYGTIMNGATPATGYNEGGAYNLNGSTQYIRAYTMPATTFTNTSYTWSVWVKGKTNSTANYMPTIGYASGSWPRLGFHQVNNIWQFDAIIDAPRQTIINCGTAVDQNEWVFLTISARYGGKMTCYKNGVQTGTADYLNDVTYGPNFSVGHGLGSAWPDYIQGTVDDVKIYLGALTASTIKKQYLAGLATHPHSIAKQ